MQLKRKLFLTIILFSLTVMAFCSVAAVVSIHHMAAYIPQANEELAGQFLPILRSGFSQLELYQWQLLTEFAGEVVPDTVQDPYMQLDAICDHLQEVWVLGDEIIFLMQDVKILAAYKGRERERLREEDVISYFENTIEADPEAYGQIWEGHADFKGVLEEVRENKKFMAYSKQSGKDELLLIHPLTEKYQLGIFTMNRSGVRWMEALYELQADSNTKARQYARQEAYHMLLFIFLGTFLLACAGIAAALHITRLLADPVEQEKEENEQQLRIREEENLNLMTISRLKTESLGNLSHELKTPLTVVSTYLEECQKLLRLDPGEGNLQKIDRNMKLIMAEANRSAMLISQILDLSAIEEGRMTLHLQESSLLLIVQDVLNTYYPILSINGNTLLIERENTIPLIQCDDGRIRQVLINILHNAAKNTKNGTITISLSRIPGGIQCQVSDSGAGIGPEDIPYIFDRYYTSKAKAGHGKNTGTGLGLFISKHIVEAHGGQIGIKSELGKGTVIWFTIPEKTVLSETDISSLV